MARFTIIKQRALDSWFWECTHDPSINGFAQSRREARQRARENCPNGEASIIPPPVDFIVTNGYLIEFTYANLFNVETTFQSSEITQEVFEYVFGYEKCFQDLLPKEKVVQAILKIWGIFRDGDTEDEIMNSHNLTESQFNMLYEGSWINIVLEISEDETEYLWTFTGR